MGVVGQEAIRSRLKEAPHRLTALVVTPLDENGIDTDSIDLRLGTRFLLPRVHKLAHQQYGRGSGEGLVSGEPDPKTFQELVHVPRDEFIWVPPHGTILGATLEYLKLPFDLSGQVLTKSSLARIFITIATAPWIHPLYRGCLTLEIANSSNTPISLSPGQRIAQLVLLRLENAKRPRTDHLDSYAGPIYPELSSTQARSANRRPQTPQPTP